MHRREMTLMGSRNAMPGDFDKIIQLIADGKIDTKPWITHRTTIDSIIEDFPKLLDPAAKVLKAMVKIQ
jgi:alcohol dehydrogenase